MGVNVPMSFDQVIKMKDKQIAELEIRIQELTEERDMWRSTAAEFRAKVIGASESCTAVAEPFDLVDNVHSPAHYTQGGIETIDFIRAKLTPEEFAGYCKGNALKYVSRATHKGGVEDLRKAGVYLGWAVGGER